MEFCCRTLRRCQGLDEYPLRSLSILDLSNSTLKLNSLLHGRIYPRDLHARILCVLYRFTQRSLSTPSRLLSRHKSLKHSTVYRKSRSETKKKFSRSNNLNVESIVDMLATVQTLTRTRLPNRRILASSVCGVAGRSRSLEQLSKEVSMLALTCLTARFSSFHMKT